MDMTLGQRYANALEQLLPRGWAWQKRGCDDSLLGRVLRAESEELARFHVWFEQQIKASIERFSVFNQGWSAPEYEQLLQDRFGITAEVTDGLMPMTCEDHCEHALLDHTVVYIYVITVDDVSTIPDSVKNYLREYQQSHTHFHFRDRSVQGIVNFSVEPAHVETTHTLPGVPWVIAATHTEDNCESALYEQDYTVPRDMIEIDWGSDCESPLYEYTLTDMDIVADWSWRDDELPLLNGWQQLAALAVGNITARRDTHASH